jgi:hypothetical protein
MRTLLVLSILALLVACGGGGEKSASDQAGIAAGSVDSTLVARGRAATNKLQLALKQELSRAVEEGGAVNALSVCNVKALPIAEDVGRELGVSVGRVSLRNRSPRNEPTAEQAAVLQRFAQDGAPADTVLTLADGDRLYMRPIRITSSLCLNCHGTEADLTEGVAARLDELYPDDDATGYHEGELRGAFTVLFPAAE